TLRCTRLATAGFARFRERVNSNVRPTFHRVERRYTPAAAPVVIGTIVFGSPTRPRVLSGPQTAFRPRRPVLLRICFTIMYKHGPSEGTSRHRCSLREGDTP